MCTAGLDTHPHLSTLRVGDKEILTGETGTAGGKLQTSETVQTAGRRRTGRMRRGEETEETRTGTGGWNYSSVEKDEDRGGERN